MPVLEYNKLSLGAKNSTVDAFKILVEEALGNETKSKQKDVTSTLPQKYESELDKPLYDKAAGLPEAKTVSFKYLDIKSDVRYGIFKGKNIYSDFNGTIDTANKGTGNQLGWVILDRSSTKYCLFVNYGSNTSIIIAITDFEIQPLIEDFSPLYDKLKERKYEFDDSFIDDTHLSTSLAVSMKDAVADILSEKRNTDDSSAFRASSEQADNSTSWDKLPTGEFTIRDKLFNIWKMYMSAYMMVGEFSLLIQRIANGEFFDESRSFNIFPVSQYTNFVDKRKLSDMSKLSTVQAIVYDIPEYFGKDENTPGNTKAHNMLFCFQQPETVSYTSSAAYESVTPRGAQVPYQYYQNANQIEISFDLRWHIDEIRGIDDNMTLGDIETMAESFTRPWETDNGSLIPKVCGVILPGISRVGYISSVNISYTGSMTGGKYTDNKSEGFKIGPVEIVREGVGWNSSSNRLTDESGNMTFQTDYHYSELTASFTMILLKDVTLQKSSGDPLKETTKFKDALTKPAAEDKPDPFALAQQAMNAAAMIGEAAGGFSDAVSQMNTAAADFLTSV